MVCPLQIRIYILFVILDKLKSTHQNNKFVVKKKISKFLRLENLKIKYCKNKIAQLQKRRRKKHIPCEN